MKIKNLIIILLSLFIFNSLYAKVRVTIWPKVLVKKTDTIRISWDDGTGSPLPTSNTCKVVYGVSPSNYTSEIPETSPGGYAEFIPENIGMSGGVYYFRVSNTVTNELSKEYKLYIDSDTAVQMSSPANYAALDDLTPLFEWQPVAGSPYYTIFVFDTLADIDIGSDSVTINANVIWGATTDKTYIEYSTPDPSGYYSNIDAPPLMQGITYSWVVLNNYSGTPSMVSEAFAGTYSFTVNPPANCSAPNLISPANGVTFTSSPITLSWTAVTNANNYEIILMRVEEGGEGVFGSQTAPLWNAYTTNTQIQIPANIILTNSEYKWYVIALDSTGKGAKSEVRNFYFSENTTQVDLYVKETIDTTIEPTGLTSVPQAILYIETVSGGVVNAYPYTCDNDGHFYKDFPYGNYKVTIKKEGYTTATYYFSVSTTPVSETFILTRSAYSIRGYVYDDLTPSNPVNGAEVIATDPLYNGVTSSTNTLSDGSFVVYVNTTGVWRLDISKNGYAPTYITISVSNEETVIPYNIILNKNQNILSGNVMNENSEGIVNALVKAVEDGNTANSYSTYTNSSGNYTLNLPDGTWIVTVEKVGFVSPSPYTVSLSGGETKTKDFIMQTQANIITGDVTDGSAPLKDVLIRAIPSSGSPVETYTDVYGHYELSVGSGDYTVEAIKTGYTSDGDKNVSFSGGGETKTINFTMSENGSFVNGRVTIDTDGNTPLSGALVTNGYESVYTNSNGEYTLSMLSGTYTISASKEGYTSDGDKVVTIGPGETINNINFVLSPNASIIRGDVKDNSGNVIVNATVYAISTDVTETAYTDSNGEFSISIKNGTYDVYAAKEGYLDSSHKSITLAPGEESNNNHFILTYDVGYISGTVKDDSSNPVYNAEVVVYNSSGITKTTYTDTYGNYLIGIKTGGYEIFANKNGYTESDHFSGTVDASNTTSNPSVQYLIITQTSKTIDGYIFDDKGNSLNNVKITITGQYNTVTVYTDGNGYYNASLIGNEDAIEVKAEKSGYITNIANENFGGADYISRNYSLNPDYGILSGTINVTAPDTVDAVVDANGNTKSVVNATGQTQSFNMNLFPGTYTVIITQTGYEDYTVTNVAIASGNTTNIGSINLTKINNFRIISGNVKDSNSSNIEGATIEIRKNSDNSLIKTLQTDINGNYSAVSLTPDIYDVYTYKSGYSSSSQTVDVSSADANNIDFVLTQNTASIYVYVSDGINPIYNAEVYLEGNTTQTAGYTGSGNTDYYGGVTITSMKEGGYNLTVQKTGYLDVTQTVSLTAGNTLNVNVIMNIDTSQVGIVLGNVVDENNSPLEAVDIKIYEDSNPGIVYKAVTTSSDGTFITNLPFGNYIIMPEKINYYSIPYQENIVISSSSNTVNVNFTLKQARGGSIVLTGPSVPIFNENIGGPYKFNATYKDEDNKTINVNFSWRVEPEEAGTIDSNGIFTPTSDYIGEASVIVSALSKEARLSFNIYQKLNPSYSNLKLTDYDGFYLDIPAGAASSTNTIDKITLYKKSITKARRISGEYKAVGKIYDLTEGFKFDKDVKITLPLIEGYDSNNAKIGLWDKDSLKWVPVGGNIEGNFISCNVSHFSEYAVLTLLKPLGVEFFNLTPNPFSPYHTGLKIKYAVNSLEGGSVEITIKIYNVLGEHIRTLLNKEVIQVGKTNEVIWDGKDDKGRWVANGRYFIHVKLKDTSGEKNNIYQVVVIK